MAKSKKPAVQQTTINVTPEERAALDYIRKVRPELDSDASARRAAIFELARKLNWTKQPQPELAK